MSPDDFQSPTDIVRAGNEPARAEVLEQQDSRTDLLDDLVATLYGGVDSNQGFDPFLQHIKKALNLTSCCLAVIQKEPQPKGLYGWATGYPPGVVPVMLKTGLVFKDEAIARALESGPNTVFSYADGDPGHDVLAGMSKFSRTWVRAAGIIDSAVIGFTNKFRHHIVLVLNRHKSATVFSREDMALIARLKKHAEIALDLYERLHRSEQGFRDLKTSIAVLKQPVAVFSPVSLLISASPAFEEIGEEYGVFTVNQESREIEFQNKAFGRDFYTQLMLVITGQTEALDDNDTLYLKTSALPLRFSITPIQNRESDNRTALVEIFDPNNFRRPGIAEIRKVINATEAEARVCLSLLNGADIAKTAAELDLAVSTIRTNVKSVLQKNNFHRQVELVSHLVRVCS